MDRPTLVARSEAGAVTALLEGTAGSRPVVIDTVSGPVDLTLPPGIGLDVRTETSAALSCAFPLRRRRIGGRTRGAGTFGQPLRDVLVRSESGGVSLRRGSR